MKILLTGSHGFIGTAVRRKLATTGHKVVTVDALEPRVHRGPHPVDLMIHSNAGAIYETDADVCIHLAAQVGVEDSMHDRMRYVEDNTADTARLLRGLEASGCERMVVASSMSVYGDPHTSAPITEGHRIDPQSVYGLTKYDQEKLCQLSSIPTTTLRFFNVYGPGQALHNPYTGVIANFAQLLLNDEAPVVYEDGQQTRDFIYVDDVAEAVVQAALQPLPPTVFNVCTGAATTIEDMAYALAYELGRDIPPTITGAQRPGDIRHCVGNDEKLHTFLPSWNPRRVSKGLKLYAQELLHA